MWARIMGTLVMYTMTATALAPIQVLRRLSYRILQLFRGLEGLLSIYNGYA